MTTLMSAESKNSALSSPLKTITITWLIAGTLDLSMAITVWALVLKKVTAGQILQGIASGVFGQAAFTGGNEMLLYGILFHYIIALCFTVAYFLVFPYIPFLKNQRIISGLLYGIFAWAWMRYVVLPFSNVHQSPFNLANALISIAILMVCIGLPISLIVSRYYNRPR